MNLQKQNYLDIGFKVLLCALLFYFPIFLHLGFLPIRLWDESRLAISAYEMFKNGNYLVAHFDGLPDMWNTKPPLLLWIQAFFINLFGTGELAIRLPSAVAALFTAIALVIFGIKYLKDYWFGFISAMVLITAYGYINYHVSRTGDYDSLLVLFSSLYVLFMFAYTETKQLKFLHLFFLSFTLAVLTKSVQGFLFLPGVFIYLLLSLNIKTILNKWFFINLGLSILVIASYYLGREYFNPGYLDAVLANELGGRFLEVNEQHAGPFMLYYTVLINYHFAEWYWLVPCGVAVGLLSKDARLKKITLYSVILVLSYWLIISISKTKLEWYEAPMFPFLSILAAVFIYSIFKWLLSSEFFSGILRFNIFPYLFLFIVFLNPYEKIISKVYLPKDYEWEHEDYRLSAFIQNAIKTNYNLNDYGLCYEGYNAHIKIYAHMLEERNQSVAFMDWNTLQPGAKILVAQESLKHFIEDNYKVDIIRSIKNTNEYLVHDRK